MTLRRKLLLVALCTLALPIAGWFDVRQMEASLRDGQAQALLASARAVERERASSSAFLATFMPRPPPPAVALISTG